MRPKKIKALQVLNIIGFSLVIVVNALANILPIAGIGTGEVSALYPSLFTPAGFTFSIWGVIYLLLLIFVIYQAKGLFGKANEPISKLVNQIGIWFLISCLANASWIFVWHHQMISASLFIMLVILFSLIKIYINLGIGKSKESSSQSYLVQIPFSVYLGWITVAAIANISIFLINIGWKGFGLSPVFWTVVVIGAATAITILMLVKRKGIFFSLVILWAFFGIISKRMSISAEPLQAIIISLGIGMVAIFGLMVCNLARRLLK
jgi:hypothetical protein